MLPVNRWILCIFLQHGINVSRKNPCHRPLKKLAQASDQITSCSASGVNICTRTKGSLGMRKYTTLYVTKHNNKNVSETHSFSSYSHTPHRCLRTHLSLFTYCNTKGCLHNKTRNGHLPIMQVYSVFSMYPTESFSKDAGGGFLLS